MKKWSQVWIWLSLSLLTVFLTVWVVDSYQEAKSRLEGKVHLDLAHLLLESVNINFPAFINELEIGTTESTGTIKVNIGTEATVTQLRSEFLIDSFKKDIAFFPGTPIKKDTVADLWLPTERMDTGWATGSKMIIATTRDKVPETKEEMRAQYPEKYQHKFDEAMSFVPRKALKNIVPQILIALGLLGSIIFAVVMMQRNFRDKALELEAKNQFISNMTHELKTPVATIGIALEAIQDFDVAQAPEKANQYISTSRKEVKRLTKLIDRVMEIAQTQQAPATYQKETVPVAEVLQAVITSMEPQIESRQAQLSVQVPAEEMYLIGDIEHLGNMLRNILDNSLKYSQKGVDIEVEMKKEGEQLHLRIQDNGIGIPARFQKKVFDQFFRVPTGNVHTTKGHGLGLNYVAQVVKAHKGKIQLHSEEGKGTSMVLKFPLSQA
ncbi:MAG: HAMP domain-containing sensor histidine kinase [Bacteroidota bacterium]